MLHLKTGSDMPYLCIGLSHEILLKYTEVSFAYFSFTTDRNVSLSPSLVTITSLPAPPLSSRPLGAEERDHSVTAWETTTDARTDPLMWN